MKTGLMLSRLVAGIPMVAGICLMQGCTTSDGGAKAPPPETPVAPVAITNKVEAPVKVEQPVEKPVEKPKLKTVASTATAYKSKAGETVADIAAKYGKHTKDVMALNPDILNATRHLKAGQTVYLPNPVDLSKPRALPKKTVKKPAAETAVKPAAEAATASAGEETYVVKSGDSVATIAAKHHVKRADLIKANNLKPTAVLKVGQKLVLPAKVEKSATSVDAAPVAAPVEGGAVVPPPVGEAVPPPPGVTPAAPGPVSTNGAAVSVAPVVAEPKTYVVKPDEDLYAVAIRWGVSPSELKALNNLTSSELRPGQVLKIPAGAASAP
jgi:LysM repeat protein